jgi:hypothetical protein
VSKPFGVGAYAYQRLNLVAKREGLRTRYQGFKPDLGNSAVRHYRGASENVAMVEMRSQLAIERAGLVTLRLQPARRSSIPTTDPVRPILNERRLLTSIEGYNLHDHEPS